MSDRLDDLLLGVPSLEASAGDEFQRLGVVPDPVFAGHKVRGTGGDAFGFKGEHVGQAPEDEAEAGHLGAGV